MSDRNGYKSYADFSFSHQDLDESIGQFFGFMSQSEEKGFAVLWGMTYIYDFLIEQKLVTNDVKDQALKHINSIKKELMKLFEDDIWRFDFVHTWDKPKSVSSEVFQEEQDIFQITFTERKPSSPSPVQESIEQMSLFDELFGESKNRKTKSKISNGKKKKKRTEAKKGRKGNRNK